jgi:hypothetical protein
MIFGPTESDWPLTTPITLDVVQAAWNLKQRQGRYCGNERLLNLLDRIHRAVCIKYQMYALYEALDMKDDDDDEDFKLVSDRFQPQGSMLLSDKYIGGIIDSNRMTGENRRHGRSRCTCGLRPSNASVNNKKDRLDTIRQLLCVEWANELQNLLQIRDNIDGYGEGDGPFQNTWADHQAQVGEQNELLNPVETRPLNAMLLELWNIICLPDPAVYLENKACRRHRLRNYGRRLRRRVDALGGRKTPKIFG